MPVDVENAQEALLILLVLDLQVYIVLVLLKSLLISMDICQEKKL